MYQLGIISCLLNDAYMCLGLKFLQIFYLIKTTITFIKHNTILLLNNQN
jgi:hypothetical protein